MFARARIASTKFSNDQDVYKEVATSPALINHNQFSKGFFSRIKLSREPMAIPNTAASADPMTKPNPSPIFTSSPPQFP